jgi:CheY-like chemotaxis protein/AcrR family transcriptional regulator
MSNASDRPSGPESLRRLLLDAASDLLREPDTPLDLRKVAERAGKSRTSPYLVFGKESEGGGVLALRIAVAAEGAEEMARRMAAASVPRGDPVTAFRAVAEAFLEFVEENPRLFRLMYGPDIRAIGGLGEEGFLRHAEFNRLLTTRDRAGAVISELIMRAQDLGVLKRDSGAEVRGEGALQEIPSVRYLQIAWATMIGVAILRDDELLRVVGWDMTREQGARIITESVFGLDPSYLEDVARTYRAALKPSPPQETARPASSLQQLLGEREPLRAAVLEDEGAAGDDGPARGAVAPRQHASARREALSLDAPTPPAAGHTADMSRARKQKGASPRERSAPAGSGLGRFLGRLLGSGTSVEPGEPAVSLAHTLTTYSGLRRAAHAQTLLSRTNVLWIDDHPTWVASVVETLEQLGAHVTVVGNTEAAVERLHRDAVEPADRQVDVIISDIRREGRDDAGVRALAVLRAVAPETSVLFFVGNYEPSRGVPDGAAGITDSTDELLHLLMDALEGR